MISIVYIQILSVVQKNSEYFLAKVWLNAIMIFTHADGCPHMSLGSPMIWDNPPFQSVSFNASIPWYAACCDGCGKINWKTFQHSLVELFRTLIVGNETL